MKRPAVCAFTLLSFLVATLPAHASGGGSSGGKKPGTALVPYRPQLPATTPSPSAAKPGRGFGLGATRSGGTRRVDLKRFAKLKPSTAKPRTMRAEKAPKAAAAPAQTQMPAMPAMPRHRIARAVRVAAIAVMVLAVPTGFALVGGSYVALILGGFGLSVGMMAFKRASARLTASTALAAAQYEQFSQQFAAQQVAQQQAFARQQFAQQHGEIDPTPSDAVGGAP
jgi:hypothetical protein